MNDGYRHAPIPLTADDPIPELERLFLATKCFSNFFLCLYTDHAIVRTGIGKNALAYIGSRFYKTLPYKLHILVKGSEGIHTLQEQHHRDPRFPTHSKELSNWQSDSVFLPRDRTENALYFQRRIRT